MEHLADLAPFVHLLDAPVPQTGEQLADNLKLVDTQTLVEQAVDVLKISQDSIQQRMVDRDLRHPQMAEQFVEVPTVLLEKVSASSAHKPYKQQQQQQPSPEG